MFISGGGQVAPDGSFTLNGIAPGEYSLEVRTQPRLGTTEGMEFGSTPIVVTSAEITGVRIVTSKGATVSGRVIFEGTSPQSTAGAAQFRVSPTPADPSRPFMVGVIGADPRSNGTIDENGNFALSGLSSRVFLLVTAAGWVVKSISLDGEDVTDEPIDLTSKPLVGPVVIRLTDKVTQISGQVSDARGERTRECAVVFQSAEAREPVVAAHRAVHVEWIVSNTRYASGQLRRHGHRIDRTGTTVRAGVPTATPPSGPLVRHPRRRDGDTRSEVDERVVVPPTDSSG